jgi:uncharacterized protein (TIGR03067 family)
MMPEFAKAVNLGWAESEYMGTGSESSRCQSPLDKAAAVAEKLTPAERFAMMMAIETWPGQARCLPGRDSQRKRSIMIAFRVGLMLLVATPALAVTQGDNGVKEELQKLQGTWKVVAMNISGEDVLAKAPPIHFIIKDATVAQKVEETVALEATIEINPKANPKQITLIAKTGPNMGKKDMAIYILEGDTLKVAGYTGDASLEKRLETFPKGPKMGVDIFEMKRVKG